MIDYFCSFAIKKQREGKNTPRRWLWKPWAVTLWHRKAGVGKISESWVSSGPLCLKLHQGQLRVLDLKLRGVVPERVEAVPGDDAGDPGSCVHRVTVDIDLDVGLYDLPCLSVAGVGKMLARDQPQTEQSPSLQHRAGQYKLFRVEHSHWSRSIEICWVHDLATPALLCYRDTAQGTQSPLNGNFFMA